MPVKHNLTNDQIQQVQDLINQGKYSEVWQLLASYGDSYADDAANVTGNP